MKRILTAAFCLLAVPLNAQTPEVKALAMDYAALPGVQRMLDDMFSAEALADQFRSSLPANVTATEGQIAQIGILLSNTLRGMRPDLEQAMIDASARHFSADELKALIAFYQSPHGSSVMAKMQPMFTDYMGEMGPKIMAATQAAQPEIMRIMTEQ